VNQYVLIVFPVFVLGLRKPYQIKKENKAFYEVAFIQSLKGSR